jgi:hypothetical protein
MEGIFITKLVFSNSNEKFNYRNLSKSNPVRIRGELRGSNVYRIQYFPAKLFTDAGEVVYFKLCPPFFARIIVGTHFS